MESKRNLSPAALPGVFSGSPPAIPPTVTASSSGTEDSDTPMTYSEKLKKPQWQKKRLEILERDKFTCQECSSTEEELHVHHRCYQTRTEPWDYPDANFVTLCKTCHANRGVLDDRLKEILGHAKSEVLKPLIGLFEYFISWEQDAGRSIKNFSNIDLAIICALSHMRLSNSQFYDPDTAAKRCSADQAASAAVSAHIEYHIGTDTADQKSELCPTES